jgi:hypothetical protein
MFYRTHVVAKSSRVVRRRRGFMLNSIRHRQPSLTGLVSLNCCRFLAPLLCQTLEFDSALNDSRMTSSAHAFCTQLSMMQYAKRVGDVRVRCLSKPRLNPARFAMSTSLRHDDEPILLATIESQLSVYNTSLLTPHISSLDDY